MLRGKYFMGTWELMFHEDTELISQTAASGFHVKIAARIRSTVHRFPCDQFDRDKWNFKTAKVGDIWRSHFFSSYFLISHFLVPFQAPQVLFKMICCKIPVDSSLYSKFYSTKLSSVAGSGTWRCCPFQPVCSCTACRRYLRQ